VNNVVQFVVRLVPALGNTAEAVRVPLAVPDQHALRVRYVEFRLEDFPNADRRVRAALSKVTDQPAREGTTAFETYNGYLAYMTLGWEASGTSGLSFGKIYERIDVWDMDYRMVMPPTFHVLSHTTSTAVVCVVAGEMVKASMGQRNAIIAWQGGLFDA